MSVVWVIRKGPRVGGFWSVLLVSYLEPVCVLTQNALSFRDFDNSGMLLSNQSIVWTKLLLQTFLDRYALLILSLVCIDSFIPTATE